jgi:hypothetical protein
VADRPRSGDAAGIARGAAQGRARRRRQGKGCGRQGRRQRQKAGFPFRPYESIADWSLAADTPHLLALTGEQYAFTGGAHGNTGYVVRLWDKPARRSIGFEALFTDWPRARKLIEPAFCAALADAQRRRVGAQPRSDINACPKLGEQPMVPFAGLGRRANQLRVLLAPYVAGAYSEGSYLITMPWPDAVKPLVKPAYQADLFSTEP